MGCLDRKAKKQIATKILAEGVADYDFGQDMQSSREELFGLEEQVSSKGIVRLE